MIDVLFLSTEQVFIVRLNDCLISQSTHHWVLNDQTINTFAAKPRKKQYLSAKHVLLI